MTGARDGWPDEDSADLAMRRLTLTRMLIWAAREAREIDCREAADRLESALDAVGDCIRRHRQMRSL
ncbi:MAG: hypothetical protein KatS3mg118_0440 [Paracoccaceae bacterium]|nr:MAG: hypothetical protein D6686_07085 [Alphaproteobacteria bacterium]GIX12481.1 MAG: hypothetical protein KatS3mg118_0440 [Paracoccaceae bacterium]